MTRVVASIFVVSDVGMAAIPWDPRDSREYTTRNSWRELLPLDGGGAGVKITPTYK